MGYRGKLKEQRRARELRSQAWTLQEIADELGVSKSSVSLWVRDVVFTPRPRQRTAPSVNGPNALRRRKLEEIERLRRKGIERIGHLDEQQFLVAGVALYAGDGTKRPGAVAFTNTNPQMIAFFCAWLRRFFDVDESRLRVRLYLHQGLDLDAATRFWSAVTDVPGEQFGKPYRAVADGGIRHSKHQYGCANVRYACTRTHRAIMGLVEGLLGEPARYTFTRGQLALDVIGPQRARQT